MDIHYWRNSHERPQFFRSTSFALCWNGLRKSIKRGMERHHIESIKITSEREEVKCLEK